MNRLDYKDWRHTGLAFEMRLANNNIPNRTYSSYVPGKHKKSRDSVMVRGFWGDII